MLYYCVKCGRRVRMYADEKKKCDLCKGVLLVVPDKYIGGSGSLTRDPELRQEFMEQYIFSSPGFDKKLYDKMENWQQTRWSEHRIPEPAANQYSVECPYCHSPDLRSIGYLERLGSAELWGLGSSKIGKQFHCNNCGANF